MGALMSVAKFLRLQKPLSIVAVKIMMWRFSRMDAKLARMLRTDLNKRNSNSRRSEWAEDVLGDMAVVVFLVCAIALAGIVLAVFI